MTQPRIVEPSAQGPGPARRDDWRGVGLDAEIEAARTAIRESVRAALAGPPLPAPDATVAWAAAELAAHHCLDLALDRLYALLGQPRPAANLLPGDLAGRAPTAGGLLCRALNAPDARTRYVFVEDLLAHVAKESRTS